MAHAWVRANLFSSFSRRRETRFLNQIGPTLSLKNTLDSRVPRENDDLNKCTLMHGVPGFT